LSRLSTLQNSGPPRDDIDGKTPRGRLEHKGPSQTLQGATVVMVFFCENVLKLEKEMKQWLCKVVLIIT